MSGAVFKKNEPRILSVNEYSLDIQPTGHILLITHIDRPKLVGEVGMILGERGVNIAGMQLDRERAGGKAMMILTIDHEVTTDVLAKIKTIKDIKTANYVAF